MTTIEKTFSLKKWEGKEVRYYVIFDYSKSGLYISKAQTSNLKYTWELSEGYFAHADKCYNHAVEEFLKENETALISEAKEL